PRPAAIIGGVAAFVDQQNLVDRMLHLRDLERIQGPAPADVLVDGVAVLVKRVSNRSADARNDRMSLSVFTGTAIKRRIEIPSQIFLDSAVIEISPGVR